MMKKILEGDRPVYIHSYGHYRDQMLAVSIVEFLKRRVDRPITLATYYPSLFRDISLAKVIDLNKTLSKFIPQLKKEYDFVSIGHVSDRATDTEYISDIDALSLKSLGVTLPKNEKEIILPRPQEAESNCSEYLDPYFLENAVLLDAGDDALEKIPPQYWIDLLQEIIHSEMTPVIINGPIFCEGIFGVVDLRYKLSWQEIELICFRSHYMITAAPRDFRALWAIAGTSNVGFFSFDRNPDYLLHWRMGQHGLNMYPLNASGIKKEEAFHFSLPPASQLWHDFMKQASIFSWPKELAFNSAQVEAETSLSTAVEYAKKSLVPKSHSEKINFSIKEIERMEKLERIDQLDRIDELINQVEKEKPQAQPHVVDRVPLKVEAPQCPDCGYYEEDWESLGLEVNKSKEVWCQFCGAKYQCVKRVHAKTKKVSFETKGS